MSDIKIKIDGQTYLVNPVLTLGEYMTLLKEKEDDLSTPKLLSILTGIDESVIRKMDNKTATYITNRVIKEKMSIKKKEVKATFEFNGTLYGLETDLTKINFGGWIDLETFTSMGYKENMDKIAAIYYRPIIAQVGKKYYLEEYDTDEMLKRAEDFKELPFDYVVGANTFFLQFTNQYIKSITHSLRKKNQKMKNRKKAQSFMKKILPNYLYGKLPQDFTRLN